MSDLRPISYTSIATLHGMIFTCDYGQDVGNLHVVDWLLYHIFGHPQRAWPGVTSSHLRISPADWSR